MLTEPRLPLLLQCPVGLHGPLSLLPDNPLSGQRRAQRLGHAARAQKPPKHQRLLPRLVPACACPGLGGQLRGLQSNLAKLHCVSEQLLLQPLCCLLFLSPPDSLQSPFLEPCAARNGPAADSHWPRVDWAAASEGPLRAALCLRDSCGSSACFHFSRTCLLSPGLTTSTGRSDAGSTVGLLTSSS